MTGISRLWLVLSVFTAVLADDCRPRDYGYGSVVCVDRGSHCHLLPEPVAAPASIAVVTSDKAGKRWQLSQLDWQTANATLAQHAVVLTVDSADSAPRQTVEGWGGAFTDASGINIQRLPSAGQDCITRSYFGTGGLGYTLGRLPIGGSDFSPRGYTYDDLPPGETDEGLGSFALQPEDLDLKIPLIKAASRLAGRPIRLVASPWSAPVWMKTNDHLTGKGRLQRRYWGVYARYIVKFLEQYRALGVPVWALTPQNEPSDGTISDFPINAMGWSAEQQAEWIGQELGPALRSQGFNDTKIYILDDIRIELPHWVQIVMSDPRTVPFVSGVAVHWYADGFTPSVLLDQTHRAFPGLPILYTEACTGQWPWQLKKVVLGSWARAEKLVWDILDTLNHWSTGWIDWNLALDLEGGPNWNANFVDAPIIVNSSSGESYKQPLYYVMAHVTKLLPPGSVVLEVISSAASTMISAVAARRPDGCVVLVLLNRKRTAVTVHLRHLSVTSAALLVPAKSVTSFVMPGNSV